MRIQSKQMSEAAAVPDHEGPRAGQSGGGPAFPSIIVQGAAMARIEAEMGGDTGSEIGGVLVGNAAPSTNFVLVTGSLPAPSVDVDANAGGEGDGSGQSSGHFTFTAAMLEE